jgi:heat shock protein HslJ
VAGVYGGKFQSESGLWQVVRLFLNDDQSAAMTTAFLTGEPSFLEVGTWEAIEDGKIEVKLTERVHEREYETPLIILIMPQEEMMEAVEYGFDRLPSAKFWLTREPDILTTSWVLVEIEYAGGTVRRPSDPEEYALRFLDEGKVEVRSDCRRGIGVFSLIGYNISFHVVEYTSAADCGSDSLEADFTKALELATACRLEDGYLLVDLTGDFGVMSLAPAGSALARPRAEKDVL